MGGLIRKLLLIIGLLFFLYPNPGRADYLYSHINIGYVVQADITDMTWMGQHSKIFIGASHSFDYTDALSSNSSLLLFRYISGNGIYKYGATDVGSFEDVRVYADAHSLDAEDYFFHYDDDKTYSTGTRSTTVLVSGYSAGLIPGISGIATQASNARAIHPQWGSDVNASKTISAISRTSNVVTVQTSTSHGLEKGDRIAIAGVTDLTNFPNGNYNIATRMDADEFTISWSGSDASSSGGTITYNAWSNYMINYTSEITSAYYKSIIDDSIWGADSVGNKFNGFFYDSILNSIAYASDSEIEKMKDYKDASPPPSSVNAWLIDIITAWLEDIKTTWVTYLSGSGKTAYTSANADNLINITGDRLTFYQGDGTDIILLEYGISPNSNQPSIYIPYSKNVWELQDIYGKKVIWECGSYATHPIGKNTWTLYSGYIYYSEFSDQTVPVISQNATTVKTSIGSMTAGSHYWDSAAKRLYIWLSGGTDPNTIALTYTGLDKSRLFSLAWYYCFGLHANGYYFPWHSGATYNIQPNDSKIWFDAINYDIGSPTTGGQKRDNSGNWSTATDEWEESCSTSSKAFKMWIGNGVETDDLGYALSTSHILYARKFSNGYVVFRMRSSYQSSEYVGTRPKTFTTPFNFRKLNGDGSLEAPTQSFTLAQGEGVILITNIGSTPPYYGISSGGATFR